MSAQLSAEQVEAQREWRLAACDVIINHRLAGNALDHTIPDALWPTVAALLAAAHDAGRDEVATQTRSAGSLLSSDLGAHISVTADKGYVVEGTLVAIGHNASLGQSYVGVGSGPKGRDTRGIHVDHAKVVRVRAALYPHPTPSTSTEA